MELSERPKGDKAKVKPARQSRTETTMSLSWMADRLPMGSWTQVSNLLRDKIYTSICVNSEDTCPRVTQAVSRLKRKPGRKLEMLKQRPLQTEKNNA